MKKTISMASIGIKILSVIFMAFLTALTITLCAFYYDVPWYCILISVISTLFCLVGCLLAFNYKIVVDFKKDILKISKFITKKFRISDIKDITIDTNYSLDKMKFCFVLFIFNNSETYKACQYITMLRKRAVKITEDKITELKKLLKLT